jgi:hypothetical protein
MVLPLVLKTTHPVCSTTILASLGRPPAPPSLVTMKISLFAVAVAGFAAVSLADELNIYGTAEGCDGTPIESYDLP